jgi:uncharacterized sulfatase
MDERYDLVRTLRDKRYVYIRNYMPHKIYGQFIDYMFQTPTTQIWSKLHEAGNLPPKQGAFWNTKPPEELYDLQNDPDEVSNLAASPAHQDILRRMRKAQQEFALRIRDVGFLPEGEIHSRAKDSSPYEMGHDNSKYPLQKIMNTAELASSLKLDALPQLKKALEDNDSAVRYWAALGILMRGDKGVQNANVNLHQALKDDSPYVRIVAAQALGQYGSDSDLNDALPVLGKLAPIEGNGLFVSLMALNALDDLGKKAAGALGIIKALPTKETTVPQRLSGYVPNLIKKITKNLESQ